MKRSTRGFKTQVAIAAVAIMVIGGGVYAYNESKEAIIGTTACLGKADPYYSIGFGVEHAYEGKIDDQKLISIILSCDHKKLTITGAVNQVISEDMEIADLSSGTEVVEVSRDYDFDGYNDLSSITSNGQGSSALVAYRIYLYDSQTNSFVLNEELSALENVYPDPTSKEIIQEFGMGAGQQSEVVRHRWEEKRLIQIK